MSAPAARAQEDRATLGIAMMLVAYFMFSLIDMSAKWLAIIGLHVFQIAFMRYLGHFVLSFTHIGMGGLALDRFKTGNARLVLIRSYLLLSSTVLNFIAVRYLPLTVTSAIMFSAPVIVCALSMPLLKEHVGPWRWAAILVGFVGVLVIIRPFDESFHWATLLALHNAFALAFYSIITRKLSGSVASETMQLYAGGFGTLVLLVPAILTWQNPTNAQDWTILVCIGLSGWAGHELLTRAHGFAAANTLMPFTYSFMIYLTIGSYLVFNEVPDRWTILGAGIIVLSGLFIWARERQRSTSKQPASRIHNDPLH